MYLNYMLRIHLLVVILFLSACNPDEQNKISPVDQKSINNSADLSFVNGAIYTVDAKHSWAEAVAIRDNKIINDNRHHLAHVQLVHPDDVSRFGELNVTASFQPLWAYNDITESYPAKLGPIRLRWNYPVGSILRSGGRIAFGSDWWVTSPDPLLGIEIAITRLDPSNSSGEIFVTEERITLSEAIAAYTINAAFINHLDDKTGSIAIGKFADLIVVDNNLFEIHPSEISDAKVLLTLFDGKVVYGSLDKLSAH